MKGSENAPGRARRGPKYAILGGFSAQSGHLRGCRLAAARLEGLWPVVRGYEIHERFAGLECSAMSFRFQKRIHIFKGLTLNLSKWGSSWTGERLGVSVSFRGDKVTGNVGVPGTSFS